MERKQAHSALLRTAAATVAFVFSTAAAATTLSYTSQAGAVSPTDGRPLGATAEFDFDGSCTINCVLNLVLANTETMTGIARRLTDFDFTTTSSGLAQTGPTAFVSPIARGRNESLHVHGLPISTRTATAGG